MKFNKYLMAYEFLCEFEHLLNHEFQFVMDEELVIYFKTKYMKCEIIYETLNLYENEHEDAKRIGNMNLKLNELQ